jgi:hypothetical protein
MKGFVKNESDRTLFVLQRAINPGFSLTFDEAYVVVGEKSGKNKGSTFVNWLRETYFQDPVWAFYKDEGESYFEEEAIGNRPRTGTARGAGKNLVRRDDARADGRALALKILDSELVTAKALIDKCKDRSVLKKALAASKLRAGKEAHMRHLIRRLEQVYF